MSAHIELSAAMGSVSESIVSSSEAIEDCGLQEVGNDTTYDEISPSQNWLPTVGETVITMYR